MQFSFLGYTYNSPLHAFFFISFLWGIPLILSALFFLGVYHLLKGNDSFFANLSRKAIIGGIIVTIVTLFLGFTVDWRWSVYGGVASTYAYYPLFLALFISLVGALTTPQKRFLSGFLISWMSFIYFLWFSLPFGLVALILGLKLHLGNIITFLAQPLGFVIGYPWLIVYYIFILVASLVGGAIGGSVKKFPGAGYLSQTQDSYSSGSEEKTRHSRYRDLALISLPLLFIPGIIFPNLIQINSERQQFEQVDSLVVVANMREETIHDLSGADILQISMDITVPEDDIYALHVWSLTSESDTRGVWPTDRIINDTPFSRDSSRLPRLPKGENKVDITYLPKSSIGDGPYSMKIQISRNKSGTYTSYEIILTKHYTTKAYSGNDFLGNDKK